MRRLNRFIAGALVVVVATPALAQVTDEDIDEARAEVNRIMSASQDLGDAVQEAWARQTDLEEEIQALMSSIELAKAQIVALERRVEEVAVQMYMGSTSGISLAFLFTKSDEQAEAGMAYLREVSGVDLDVITQLRSFREELDRQTDALAETSAEQDVVTEELKQMATELQSALIAAQAVYDDLVERQRVEEEERRRQEEEQRRLEEERRRQEEAARRATSTTVGRTSSTTQPPTTTTQAPDPTSTTAVSRPPTTTTTTTASAPPPGGGSCPVAGAVSYSDTWGAPRSGGRSHQGVDMMAARGTPVVAIFAGTVRRIATNTLGGLTVWLRSAAGDDFYYAHLDSYGDITVGQAVEEGYVLGSVGTTGNAPEWLPHLHFEFHPDGGDAVNPYPLVKSVCG